MKNYKQNIAVFIVAILSLLPRIDGYYFAGKYTWAEDGPVFIDKIHELGFPSIWSTYAGYLHVYSRLVGYLASLLPLNYTPEVLLFGWIFAYLILMFTIAAKSVDLKINFSSMLIVSSLIAMQPNSGEVFFTITNAQWILAPALALLLLIPSSKNKKSSIFYFVLLIIMCLTGPFALLLLPPLLLSGWLNKNLKENAVTYLIVIICSFIQFSMLTSPESGRTANMNGLGFDFVLWLKFFISYITFGSNKILSLIAVILFWFIFAIALFSPFKTDAPIPIDKKKLVWILLVAAFVNIAVTFLPGANPPPVVNWGDWGGGFRYTVLPYTLIIFSATIATNHIKKYQYLIFAAIAVVCLSNKMKIGGREENLQFKAFYMFSNFHNISIPINPQGDIFYPHVSINFSPKEKISPSMITKYPLEPELFIGHNMNFQKSGNNLYITSVDKNSMLLFNNPLTCSASKFIGLEISMNKSLGGMSEILWSSQLYSNEKYLSMKRYYPAGEVKAQFAFPYSTAEVYVRLKPGDMNLGAVTISNISIFCLP
jgi:hypothetical protein